MPEKRGTDYSSGSVGFSLFGVMRSLFPEDFEGPSHRIYAAIDQGPATISILMKWSLLSEDDAIGYGAGSTMKVRLGEIGSGEARVPAGLQLGYLQR